MLGWIGLKNIFKTSTWSWTDGTVATYFQWIEGGPTNYPSVQSCGLIIGGIWSDLPCSDTAHFTCYRSLTLVTKNKTWDEAVRYCRKYHTDLYAPSPYGLVRLSEEDTLHPQTASVWMGLHFLDGTWFWLNKWPIYSVSLPACPVEKYRCGAQNANTSEWENRDCNEKMNFLCY
ncbi:Collectin-12 [Bagarius yarrelli]|uniref:Collectin-12 n=1 Tax=Bagarius yarrelli TaxID=175774 RepID=A0A556V1U0_BAGYA|nr:Collectin-12 [Bagarius yarrelli]